MNTLSPKNAPLPIRPTGYRSQFTTAAYVEKFGGPERFVTAWLDQEAQKPAWKKLEAASRQYSLF